MQNNEAVSTDLATPGLIRIICIDAHIPRKRMEVKLSRHANISGSNGSGKTTLLKLVPFFYGATPTELVERVGKKTSFTDYYLARPTSLIVFEYMTSRGLKCAVVYRHASGTKPAYRFLDEPFKVEYFSELKDGESVFIDGRALGRHWTHLKLGHSQQLDTVTDYRAVIQGDRSLVHRSNQARELAQLAAAYSLGGAKGAMSHINKMTAAILSRRGNMEGIKQMIAEIMREEQIELPQIQLHKNVREIVAELGVLRNLEKNEALFRKAVNLGTNYLENSQGLEQGAKELHTHQLREADKLTALEAALTANRAELDTLKANWDEEGGALRRAQQDAEHAQRKAEAQLEQLDDAKQAWLARDILTKADEFANLDEFEEALKEARDHQRALEEGVADLKAHYDALTQKETRRHADKSAHLAEVKAAKTKAKTDEQARWQEQELELERGKSRALADHRKAREADVTELTRKVIEAEVATRSVVPTEEEKLAEAATETRRDQLEEQSRAASDAIEAATTEVNHRKRDEEAARQTRTLAQKKVAEEAEQLERLTALCQPKSGSLLAELRKHDDTWPNTLGRILREDLLDRRDLAPVYTGDDSGLVLGWNLKLDNAPKPEWATSLEEQELRRAEQGNNLDLAQTHLERKTAEHEATLKALKQAQEQLEANRRQAGQLQREYDAAKEAVKRVRAQNRAAEQERKTLAKERHKALEDSLTKLKAQIAKECDGIESAFAADLKAAHDHYLVQLSELEEAEALAAEAMHAETQTHKQKLTEITREYKEQCAQSGLDEAVLNAAIERVRKAQEKFATVRGYKTPVLEYHHWLNNEWPRRPEYEATRAEQARNAEAAGARHQERERIYKEARDALNFQHNELRQAKTKATEQRDSCQQMLRRAEYAWLKEVVDDPRPLESVLAEVESLLETQQVILKEVRSTTNTVEKVISGQGERSQITEVWEQLRKQAEAATSDPNNVDALNINLTRGIGELFNVHLPQKKETIESFVQTISGQLEDFYTGLKQISRLIQQQSRAISTSISEKRYFDAIGQIDVSLLSRIDSQDYWPYLEEFAQLYGEWREQQDTALPPEKLGDLLIKVTDILHRSKVATGIESVFDLAITLEENGRKVTVTKGTDLEHASSNGLSYLILCSIFAGITRMLCRDSQVRIHWPVDELGVIDSVNIAGLFKMLNDHNIVMVGGFPTTDPLLLQHFSERHEMRKGVGLVDIALPEDRLEALMHARRQAAHNREVTNGQ